MKLSKLIRQYIDIKQSMGSRFNSESVILRAFCKTMGDINIREVEKEKVFEYISGTGPVTRFWHRKHESLRGFYHFAIGRGYVACSPLPQTLPRPEKVFTPYIYSTDELRRLLEAAESFGAPNAKLQSTTLHTIILLLYGTGLRIGEVISLNIQDVDLHDRLLVIRESKFYKTRLVPISEQLANVLKNYLDGRNRSYVLDKTRPFFTCKHGERIVLMTVEKSFMKIRQKAEVLRYDGARYQPRLHDLRHTFAVHRLVAWYKQGANVQRLLPMLATYLGHVHITGTQKYLTMTSELLQEANARFENYALSIGDLS